MTLSVSWKQIVEMGKNLRQLTVNPSDYGGVECKLIMQN